MKLNQTVNNVIRVCKVNRDCEMGPAICRYFDTRAGRCIFDVLGLADPCDWVKEEEEDE